MQAALDNWAYAAPRLAALAEDLNHDAIPKERFHERDASSPLPRAYQWADGSAYVNHVALVRQARGAEMPDSFRSEEHTSELQSLMRISYAVFCLKKKKHDQNNQ